MHNTILFASLAQFIFGILMFLIAVFLILLVLVQRGRGGGLSGAFGGLGGQSAFGTRAGDTFTYITIWASGVWIVLCIVAVKVLSNQPGKLDAGETSDSRSAATAPADAETPLSQQQPDGSGVGSMTTPETGSPAETSTDGTGPTLESRPNVESSRDSAASDEGG